MSDVQQDAVVGNVAAPLVNLNGKLTHDQRVALLTGRLRAWRSTASSMHAYLFLRDRGGFDAETRQRIQWLYEHPDVPLKGLHQDIEPLAQALKAAFRNLCSY